MLRLRRGAGESLVIVVGDSKIILHVEDHHRQKDQMLLSFEAPADVLIYRAEVLLEIAEELARAGEPADRVEELVRAIGTRPGDGDVCLCRRCGRIKPKTAEPVEHGTPDPETIAARRAGKARRRAFAGATYRTEDVFCS